MKKLTNLKTGVILTIVGIVLSVIAVVYSMFYDRFNNAYSSSGTMILAFLEIAVFVFFLASFSTKRMKLIRVLSIIICSGLMVTTFSLSITYITSFNLAKDDELVKFALYCVVMILMFVASIFCFVYRLVSLRKPEAEKYYRLSGTILFCLTLVFALVVFIFELIPCFSSNYLFNLQYLLCTINLAFICLLPFVKAEEE